MWIKALDDSTLKFYKVKDIFFSSSLRNPWTVCYDPVHKELP